MKKWVTLDDHSSSSLKGWILTPSISVGRPEVTWSPSHGISAEHMFCLVTVTFYEIFSWKEVIVGRSKAWVLNLPFHHHIKRGIMLHPLRGHLLRILLAMFLLLFVNRELFAQNSVLSPWAHVEQVSVMNPVGFCRLLGPFLEPLFSKASIRNCLSVQWLGFHGHEFVPG